MTQPLAVATYNTRNLAPADPPERYAELAEVLVKGLGAPEILTLQELHDATVGGTAPAPSDTTIDRLLAALADLGAAGYRAFQIHPADGQDGGMPGANIRSVTLVRGDCTLAPGASPFRIGENDLAFAGCRKPLGVHLRRGLQRLLVVNTHLTSRRPEAPNASQRGAIRVAQARAVLEAVRELLQAGSGSEVIVMGDFNDDLESETMRTLAAGGLCNLLADPGTTARGTYLHEGKPVFLDHILVSAGLRNRLDVVSVLGSPGQEGPSDHLPVRAAFRLAE